jgi:predicted phosphodiesterase
MKAILSDIHGNLEALQAVLEDIDRHNVQEIYCLGDVVGDGPDPRRYLDLSMRWPVVLLGNHDQAALLALAGFQPGAGRASLWTRDQLGAPDPSPEAAGRRRAFLGERPRKHEEGDFLFVHGSARHPVREYVFPEDISDLAKMGGIFSLVKRCCFQGHTHLPGIFVESPPGGAWQFLRPEAVDDEYRLDSRKVLCNVGSVGWPKDGDWRACYALFDGDTIRFRRVEYDVASTVRKVRGTEGLDDLLGQRLLLGR